MRNNRRWFLMGAALLLLPFAGMVSGGSPGDHDEANYRWDLIHATSFMPFTFEAGGTASALANDASKITLTGSGTFEVGDNDEVTGGGKWATFSPTGVPTGSGTYTVTRLIRFALSPGTTVGTPVVDNIADKATAHSGLAALAIVYSDGSRGVLFVSCNLPVGTPPSIFEGITASKGYVDYWSRVAPVDGVDANRTHFHSITEVKEREN